MSLVFYRFVFRNDSHIYFPCIQAHDGWFKPVDDRAWAASLFKDRMLQPREPRVNLAEPLCARILSLRFLRHT